MVSITNPSFEDGFTGWGGASLGVLAGRSIETGWYTERTHSARSTLSASASRNSGDYSYWTQSINFTSFTLIIDFKFSYTDSDYEFRLYVDSTLEYQQACDGAVHTDVEIALSYTGTHTLKFGIYCVNGGNELALVYVDNLRIKGKDYYVKIGGNDTNDGSTWTKAWATINKAATTVADDSIVHIGFGDYISEPSANKIAPQNVGASGIYYLPETATTGGGTGTVSIEQNT